MAWEYHVDDSLNKETYHGIIIGLYLFTNLAIHQKFSEKSIKFEVEPYQGGIEPMVDLNEYIYLPLHYIKEYTT